MHNPNRRGRGDKVAAVHPLGDGFDNEVLQDEAVWVVEFASKMCTTCQQFGPVFESVAKSFRRVKYGVVSLLPRRHRLREGAGSS